MQKYTKYFRYLKSYPDLIYFDNASTTQKPDMVIDSVLNYLNGVCANPDRGSYKQSLDIGKKIEVIRNNVSNFINSEDKENIYFTSGSSDSVFKFAAIFNDKLNKGDEVLYSAHDHQSLIDPIMFFQEKGVVLKKYLNTDVSGEPNYKDLYSKVNNRTKLIVLTHIHNIYGLKIEIEEIRKNVPSDVFILLDATQSIGHVPVDVANWSIDGLVFSGHKMFALDGVGVLYLSNRLKVDRKVIEKGTLPVTGIISLGSAIEFINKIGVKNIHNYNVDLTQYLVDGLRKINGLEFLPGAAKIRCASGFGILSFKLNRISSEDISFILDSKNICVRSNNTCMNNSNLFDDSIRVSMHINNTKAEIDYFISAIKFITTQF